METVLFYSFAGISLLAAIGVIVSRRVFYSAIYLIICLSTIAGLYMLLNAPFIAALQIIVYAGAIMVLFLFVIMLLDPFSGAIHIDKRRYLSLLGVSLGSLTVILLYPLLRAYDLGAVPRSPEALAGVGGGIEDLAQILFNEYLLPFEVTSVLILVAIIGAVVLTKRQQ